MTYSEPARPAARRTRSIYLVLLVVLNVALVGLLVNQSLAPSTSSASSAASTDGGQGGGRGAPDEPDPAVPDGIPQGDRQRAADDAANEADGVVDEADGLVPDGVTVYDDEYAAVANLDPDLLDALRQAAAEAAGSGVVFVVNSGWRSPEYQEQLLQEAISEYGSEEEAARWVATADTSSHVSGDAVDIGPSLATAWLSQHGAEFGLCQTYGNEPWHYELRPEAIYGGCPAMYPDPTHDPRMQP